MYIYVCIYRYVIWKWTISEGREPRKVPARPAAGELGASR